MQLRSAFLGTQRFVASTPVNKPQGLGSRSVTCMAKKKGIRLIVTLECTEARQEGGTPSRVSNKSFLSSLASPTTKGAKEEREDTIERAIYNI